MNEASKLVADSLLNEFVTIKVGDKVFTVYPPSIKVLCRAISEFSKIGMDREYNKLTVLSELPENSAHIIKGLSSLIVGDVFNWRWKANRVGKQLMKLNLSELNHIREDIISLAGGDDFFDLAASLKSVATMAAKQKL